MRHDVLNIDPTSHTLTVKDLNSGDERTEAYDKLVMTTGSWPIIPPIPGIDSDRVLLCKNWAHAQTLFERAADAKRIAVIGAGYIGAELAEAYSLKGHQVTLIDAQERVMPKYFDAAFTDKIETAYREHGVTLALNQKVQSFTTTDQGVTIQTDQAWLRLT